MATLEEQETEWLWENHIPIGELTCIGGYQGLGKSFLTIDIAARLSTGQAWPDSTVGYAGGGDVILLSAEDDLARTIKPRLRAAGADLSRIHAIQGVQFADDGEADFNLERDLPALEQALQQANNPKLVLIDPISCYTGEIDDHKNKEVRGILKPLRDLAEKYRVAVIYVTHLNRSAATNALNRISGSTAFTAAPRVAWTVSQDKDDEQYRLFVQLKNNLGPNPGGLAFRIVERLVDGKSRGAIEYRAGRVDISSSEALDESPETQRGPSVLERCVAWLSAYMDSPKPASDVLEAAEANGHSKSTLGRAEPVLNVQSRRVQGADGLWYWEWYIPLAHQESQQDGQVGDVGPRENLEVLEILPQSKNTKNANITKNTNILHVGEAGNLAA